MNTIEKYRLLDIGEHVAVGLSGGADSVALINILLELPFNLKVSAVHINHGIRETESKADEDFVIELCKNLEIPLEICRFDIREEAKYRKMTTEEAGRAVRYETFNRWAAVSGATKVAVAHNMNDNAETILMRLCRGTGLRGLGGIPVKRENIIRPLMEVTRREIEEYCTIKNLKYCTDSTNFLPVYTRNKIRLELLPFLQDNFNREIVLGISKMATILNEENDFVESHIAKIYELALAHENENELALYMDILSTCHIAVKRRVIKKAYEHFSTKDLTLSHVEAILSLFNKESGKTINLPHQIYVKREYNILVIHKKESETKGFCYNISINEPVFIKELNIWVTASLKKPVKNLNNLYTKIFCYDKMEGVIQVRSRLPGDKIFVKSMGGSKKIKDYFSDTKLPARKRDLVPLLSVGGEIIWIMDERAIVSDLYKATSDRDNKLFVSINS